MNRKQILECDDIAKEHIEVPQWNKFKGYVEEMDWPRFQKYQAFAEGLKSYDEKSDDLSDEDSILLQAYTVCLTLTDLKGKRIFKDEDHKALSKKNPMIILRLASVALKLSGVDGENTEKK